jgi:hypothetical protein
MVGQFSTRGRDPGEIFYCIMPYISKIKTFIALEGSARNPNPFRVFARVLCSIYRQTFIEIQRRASQEFPSLDVVNDYLFMYGV